MKEFTKLWTEHHPDLHCNMVGDNLRAQGSDDIFATALRNSIQILNVIAGSSHWFQVHDQLQFANLKNFMDQKNFELLSDISLTPKQKRVFLISFFSMMV